MTKEDLIWRCQQEVRNSLYASENREELTKILFKNVEEREPNYLTYIKMIANGVEVSTTTAVRAVFEVLFACGALRGESLKSAKFNRPIMKIVKGKESRNMPEE